MAEVSIVVRAKDAFSKTFSNVGSGVKKLGSIGVSIGKTIAQGLAVATTAFGALFAVAGKMVAAYRAQEEAEAKLQAALTATGYAAGLTKTELTKHADELQKTTGVADDVIISTQGMIASFKNISGDSFKRTTEAIIDFAASQQKAGAAASEVEARSMMLARALDNPIQNLSILTRVGITFTDQQKEQIKAMQESGDMAGAQDVILKTLEGRFGGTAEAMNKANMGIKDFKNILGDMQEQVGKAIVDNANFGSVMERVNGALRDLAESGYIELWAEKVKAAIEAMLPVVGKLVAAIAKVGGVITGGVQRVAAFAGGVSGGRGGLSGRLTAGFEASMDVPRQNEIQKAEDLKRLEAIKTRKAKEEKAQIAKEQAEMAAARAVQTTGAAEEEVTEAKEEQVEVSEKALDVAEKELEVAEKKLDVAKEEADLIPVVQQAREQAAQSSIAAADQAPRYQYDLGAGAIQSSATQTGLGQSLAAKAEAERIREIIKALKSGESDDQIKYLEQIAESTLATSQTINQAITLG